MDLNQKAFFDKVATEWDSKNHHDPRKIKDIMNILKPKPGDHVLDVGCGTGVLIPYLLESIGPNRSGSRFGLLQEYASPCQRKVSKTNLSERRFCFS